MLILLAGPDPHSRFAAQRARPDSAQLPSSNPL
jgi:hypothetical protein